MIKSNKRYCNALSLLGENLNIESTIFDTIEEMVCLAYGFGEEKDVNEARYKRCCKEKFPEPCRMPPTSGELYQHVKRAKYQAFI